MEECDQLRFKNDQLERILELQGSELQRLRRRLMRLEEKNSISKLIKVVRGETRKILTRRSDKRVFRDFKGQRALNIH